MHKNISLFFHTMSIFLLISSSACSAMDAGKGGQLDEVVIDKLDEAAAKDALKKSIQNGQNLNTKADDLEKTIKGKNADITEREGRIAALNDEAAKIKATMDTLQQESAKKEKEANEKIKFITDNPTVHVGSAQFVNCPAGVSDAMVDKLKAEAEVFKYQTGMMAKVSHVADKVFWPTVQEQGSVLAAELRKTKYKTTIEVQNEEIGALKIKNEKKQFAINQEDLAAKRAATVYNRRNQEHSEELIDTQILGQSLANLAQVFDPKSPECNKMKQQVLEIQVAQVDILHKRTMAPKTIILTKQAPAPKIKKPEDKNDQK